jgi:hypothetical protein
MLKSGRSISRTAHSMQRQLMLSIGFAPIPD